MIAVVNQKGGTAKTTTVENLGIGLAREGKKVLLVDTDPQGSLTISLGYPRPDELEITLFDLLNKTINEDSVSAGEGILHQAEGIDLIPANISLAGLEVALVNTMNRERILKQFLEPVKGNYDYVLLDCIHDNTTEVRNIKAYMLTTLYNASMTIDHYYQTKVGHDLYGYDGG